MAEHELSAVPPCSSLRTAAVSGGTTPRQCVHLGGGAPALFAAGGTGAGAGTGASGGVERPLLRADDRLLLERERERTRRGLVVALAGEDVVGDMTSGERQKRL